MGLYPYIQRCENGHEWSAYFISILPMRDSGLKKCPNPICGSEKITDIREKPRL